MAHYDDFSKALIASAVKYLGEEGIPSLQKKGNEDDFSKKDPKAKAAPADPAINLATGSGPKQSHGAEIKYTNVVKKEEVESEETTIEEAKNKEGKEQGLDGKACWKGYKKAGTKMKGGKLVDNCVKMKEEKEDESEAEEKKEEKMSKSAKEKHEKAEEKKEVKEAKEGADKKDENKFHTKLDKLVRKTFGKSSDEKKMKEEVSLQDIVEKAVSKSQQRFMGMVHAVQKGEMKAPSKEVSKVAKGMSKKAGHDYAATKHKGLPEKVKK